jgi:uncharacterized protein
MIHGIIIGEEEVMEDRKLICRIRTGSHLYGLNTPASDEDYISVFMPSAHDLLGLHPVDEVDNSSKKSTSNERNTPEDIDDKMYSLPKFMWLLLQNNPNIVELLFATEENIIESSSIWDELVVNYDRIISQRVYHTFSGYAFSQKKKLEVKAIRYGSLKKGIKYLESLYTACFLTDTKVSISEYEAQDLNAILKYYKGRDGNTKPFHGGMPLKAIYKLLKSEYENYGWRVKTDTFETLGYDVKFGYHLIRILAEGYELISTGRISYPLQTGRYDIVCIRNGEVQLEELLELYNRYKEMTDSEYVETKLRKHPDMKWADNWIVTKLKESICNDY